MKQIGKGFFSKVYEISEDKVIIVTTDTAKLAIEDIDSGFSPALTYITNEYDLYFLECKKYARLGRTYADFAKVLNKRDLKYAQKLLRAVTNTQWGYRRYDWFVGYTEIYNFINEHFTGKLRDGLMDMLYSVSNYIDEDAITMEITPRNMMADNGKLILTDIFFDSNAIDTKPIKKFKVDKYYVERVLREVYEW